MGDSTPLPNPVSAPPPEVSKTNVSASPTQVLDGDMLPTVGPVPSVNTLPDREPAAVGREITVGAKGRTPRTPLAALPTSESIDPNRLNVSPDCRSSSVGVSNVVVVVDCGVSVV